MKNKNCIIVFMLIIAFLLVFVTGVKAADEVPPLQIVDDNEVTGGTQGNTQAPNAVTPANNTVAPTTGNTTGNTAGNTANTNTLPDTGVAEDTALFVFITICVVSAVYALVKVRNYKNV